MWPTLYAKSKSGKIKVWDIKVDNNVIIVSHGYQSHKITTLRKVVHKGKNIGRANFTTPSEQAMLEADAKYKKQIDKGYTHNVNNLKELTSPMLAVTLKKESQIPNRVAIQPKLDGVRCIVRKVGKCLTLTSRGGKDYTSVLWDLAQELNRVMYDGEIFDGELYVHGWSFERLVSAVKKESLDSYSVEYHVYDYPTNINVTFQLRYNIVLSSRNYDVWPQRLKLVKTAYNTNAKINMNMVKRIYKAFSKQGYEGVILRDLESTYKWGHRDKCLLKYKEMLNEEFQIIGYNSGTGTDAGAIIFKCHVGGQRNKGSAGYFDVRPEGTIEHRVGMYANGWTYVGKMLSVQFQGWTESGLPKFPVGLAVRDYE